jgi:hypothetical protein
MLKVGDHCVLFLMLCVVTASFLLTWPGADGGSTVRLKGEDGEWVFPIDAVETIHLSGPLGDTTIEIKGSAARITASPCLNQTCVASGAVHAPGQWAACLPNRVMLYVSEGKTEDNVDAAAW